MDYDVVCVFDSSYPSIDVALPIDDRIPHIIVSNRRIEAPPGHTCLRLERESRLISILKNFRTVRGAVRTRKSVACTVIAAPGLRPAQLVLNVLYARSLSKHIVLFDGSTYRSVSSFRARLVKGALAGLAPRFISRLKLWWKTARFASLVRTLPGADTKEGRLFGLYSKMRSFSLPLDEVAFEDDTASLYGSDSRGWYLPAYSSRRQRYQVKTTRHHLRDVSLHVERINGFELSCLFKDGRLLDYPYMLGPARDRHLYPVTMRDSVKTAERGINLLAYTSTYYHWLIEGVPRILDVIDDGFDFDEYPLLLPVLEPFQRQLLEVLGIDPNRQVITVGIGEWCHVGHCILPTANFPFASPEIEDPSGQPDRSLLLRIRERLLQRLEPGRIEEHASPTKLYISRAKAGRRKFTADTENAVTSMLESSGFVRVFLEDLSWADQVRLIARAQNVVGMHGAGLTNILFANPTALLEFHNPLEARPYFAVMARELGIRYSYIIGSLAGSSPNFDNITIDLESLSRWLDKQ